MCYSDHVYMCVCVCVTNKHLHISACAIVVAVVPTTLATFLHILESTHTHMHRPQEVGGGQRCAARSQGSPSDSTHRVPTADHGYLAGSQPNMTYKGDGIKKRQNRKGSTDLNTKAKSKNIHKTKHGCDCLLPVPCGAYNKGV